MRKQVDGASRSPARRGNVSCEKSTRNGSVRALEIVVIRGRDVISVRHLLEGSDCWVGPAQSSIINVPMIDYGGRPSMIAEVLDGCCKVHVPPRARARTHDRDGLDHLLMGPVDLDINEGERAVIVLGAIQIRARVVQIETARKVETFQRRDAWKWMFFAATLYVLVLGVCALLAQDKPKHLENGAMQRAVSATLERAAEKARQRAAATP